VGQHVLDKLPLVLDRVILLTKGFQALDSCVDVAFDWAFDVVFEEILN
jgi:hypothetical protein